MSFSEFTTGSVIRYPFLWSHEAEVASTEGRKPRPVAVGFRVPRPTGDLLLLFPITSKKPTVGRFAAEVPEIEKLRTGLDADLRAFFLPLLKKFISRRESIRGVRRYD